jgi:hypothetical protein
MSSRSKGRQAVYLVQVPADWKPQRYWDFPPIFSGGELIARNLTPSDAAGHARTHNKAQIVRSQQRKLPVQGWAIVGRHLKANWHDRGQGREGGAL